MLACISCPIDALPKKHPNRDPDRRFNWHQALSLLNKCATAAELKQTHAQIIKTCLSNDYVLVTKLLKLCSSHGNMDYATQIFNLNKTQLAFTWNIMIRAQTQNGNGEQALFLYNLMLERAVPPDKFTFPFAIKACLETMAIQKGKEIHAHVIKTVFSRDLFVVHTLMDFYFEIGDFVSARQLFDEMPLKNVVSWTTMVSGLVLCGQLEAGREMFDEMPVRNVVSWTAIINGYARKGQPHEAFKLFYRMQLENVKPNEYTLVSLLLACTEIGSLQLGSWVHDFAQKNGFGLGIFLGTALVDMYSKCGSLDDALKVFGKMPERSLATWNSMITSLGVHGRGRDALALFGQMEREKVKPDGITFVGVLCACVHAYMVDMGYGYFECMREKYGIVAGIEHYRCMVDLLCRAGMVDDAHEFAKNMPIEPSIEIWRTLLSACRDHGSVELENYVAKHINGFDQLKESELCTSIKQNQQPNHLCFKWEVG